MVDTKDICLKGAKKLIRFWQHAFCAPYKAVPWLIYSFAIIPCFIFVHNGPFESSLIGFDDSTRMAQVLQWINGGGWYDRLITRVNAPEGFQSIWSRIVDVPIAFVIVTAQLFVPQKTAAFVASVIVPMIELALMFLVARYYARPLAGKKEAWLVILFLMFTSVMNVQNGTLAGFHLGEASHHAWYGILNVLMYGAAVRIVIGVVGPHPKFMLGLAIALLLAVGVEGIPMAAGIVAVLCLIAWSFQNPALAKRSSMAVGFGAFLAFLLLPLHVRPSHWLEISWVEPSFLGPLLMGVSSAYLFAARAIILKSGSRFKSAFWLIALAVITCRALIFIFPDILQGATAGLSPNERILAATEHREVWSMYRASVSGLDYITHTIPTLIALAAGLFGIRQSVSNRRKAVFAAYAGITAVTGIWAQIYWRLIHHAQTALCPLLLKAWQELRNRIPQNAAHKNLITFGLFVVLCPLWMLLVPAWIEQAPFKKVFLYPAKAYMDFNSCDTRDFVDYINSHYNRETLIVVPDWDSTAFLFETDLKIDFLANYPSHDHFIDNRRFFGGQNLDEAKDIAIRHGFDLVAICGTTNEFITGLNPPMMIDRLRAGWLKTPNALPDWIKPAYTGIRTNYLLFSVDKNALRADRNRQ